jgi:penicillin-binding protein 1A
MKKPWKVRGVAIAALVVAGGVFWAGAKFAAIRTEAARYDLEEIHRLPAVSEVYDGEGRRYSRLKGEVRYVVPYDRISPRFFDAVIAREDSRFWRHGGVDILGIGRAALRNLRAGTVREGASTITQQLARNVFDLGKDRWKRKALEALLAQRIERRLNKTQILEAYANCIYFGVGLYGVETASRACFGKSARDLTLSEAAILAGLIRSPNRLSPLEDTRRALAQRDQVLDRMVALGMITRAEAVEAKAEQITDSKRIPPRVEENYAMDAIVRELREVLPDEVIERGGLKIHTTLDPRLQLLAENVLERQLRKLESEPKWPHPARPAGHPEREMQPAAASPYVQGALVAVDNETGGIVAIVGGRDFRDSPYNRAVLARRQVGSTFKPFVYAAAFSRGLIPGTFVSDAPLRDDELPRSVVGKWSPENSDGDDLGVQPAAIGLIRSRNTMTVRVGQFASTPAVRALAASAGLDDVPSTPAMYLGAFEATLASLVSAYTVFPNVGVRREAFLIDRIEDRDGVVIYRAPRRTRQCLRPEVAEMVGWLLGEVFRMGTAAAAAREMDFDLPAAGKTGTTDDYKDAWFLGYTGRLTCGVWVGMDRPERIVDRGYGARLAFPAWADFMREASAGRYAAREFPIRAELRREALCRVSGRLANDGCRTAGALYAPTLPSALVPSSPCTVHHPALVQYQPSAPPQAPMTMTAAPSAVPTPVPTVSRPAPPRAHPVPDPERRAPVRAQQPLPADEEEVTRLPLPGEAPVRKAEPVEVAEAPRAEPVAEARRAEPLVEIPNVPPGTRYRVIRRPDGVTIEYIR